MTSSLKIVQIRRLGKNNKPFKVFFRYEYFEYLKAFCFSNILNNKISATNTFPVERILS